MKEEEEDEEYEEDDEEEAEETLSRKERRRLKKEEKRRRKLEKKGLLEEEEELDEEKTEIPETEKVDELQGFDEAMKDAMYSIALGVSTVNQEPEHTEESSIQPQPEVVSEAEENQQTEAVEEVEEVQPEIIETVEAIEELPQEEEIPVNVNAVPKTPTVQELLAKAKQAGEEPEVKKDKENEVTLLDYSDLL